MSRIVSNYKAILSGESWAGGPPSLRTKAQPLFITYSFPTVMTADDRKYWPDFKQSWRKFSAQDILDAKAALKEWGNASGIRFLEVKGDHGDIQFSKIPQDRSGYAFYPSNYAPDSKRPGEFTYFHETAGNVYLNSEYDQTFKNSPLFKKYTLLHEIGHALGLKHPFEADTHNSRILSINADNFTNTVMSYGSGGTDLWPTKLGRFDKIAIAKLYGSRASDGKHVAKWSWNAETETLTQIGKAGKDKILGTSVADIIKGMNGNDRLHGLKGNDQLSGGYGNDVLIGGPGRDTFIFDTQPSDANNYDRITDFEVREDSFKLSSAVFKEVGPVGTLSADAFWLGTSAEAPEHRIIFDSGASGMLYYDPDGSGPLGQIAFAKIHYATALKASHFFIV